MKVLNQADIESVNGGFMGSTANALISMVGVVLDASNSARGKETYYTLGTSQIGKGLEAIFSLDLKGIFSALQGVINVAGAAVDSQTKMFALK